LQVIRALHAKRDVTKPITGHFNDPESGNFNASDAGPREKMSNRWLPCIGIDTSHKPFYQNSELGT
jgi:hypothetical protein